MVDELAIETPGRGLHEITDRVAAVVGGAGVDDGLCVLLCRHTSAGLIIQENADPSARHDLERWLDEHVPDGVAWRHDAEGPDDMPAHIRTVLTGCSLAIPVKDRRLTLGTWQGIYLWEHRTRPRPRRVAVWVGP